MLDNCKDNKERWQAVDGLLQGWLKERRELLVKYAAIAATLDRDGDNSTIDGGLERLCSCWWTTYRWVISRCSTR